MRIAIVNDSQMAVEGLRRVLKSVPGYEIAWVAHDGAEAVWRCRNDKPDLILMDLIMPVMDGVEATRRIMEGSPCAIVVVTATVEGNAAKVFQAMGLGALDAVNTPVLGMDGAAQGRDELLAKISTVRRLVKQKRGGGAEPRTAAPPPPPPKAAPGPGGSLVVIGASSGGPHALATVLAGLPADFPAPIVVVQHVDPVFAPELAQWLDRQCQLDVRLAQEGDHLKAGRVFVSGGEEHLYLSRYLSLTYSDMPRDEAYRPSVNVFFNSVADHWSGDLVGVLLTGMGRDGAEGLLRLRNTGAHTIAQDEASCAVYGMPKAAAQLNAATQILSLEEIGPTLARRYGRDIAGRQVL